MFLKVHVIYREVFLI